MAMEVHTTAKVVSYNFDRTASKGQIPSQIARRFVFFSAQTDCIVEWPLGHRDVYPNIKSAQLRRNLRLAGHEAVYNTSLATWHHSCQWAPFYRFGLIR